MKLVRAAVQPIGVDITMADGIFIKQMQIAHAFTIVPQHAHAYDHASMLAKGSVRVWKDGNLVGDFTAPHAIHIPARAKHRFLSLVDDTIIYCIHNIERSGAVDIHEEHHLEGIV